jgi:2,5-diamino-6-(ribosylamino)-4(3H)-pyrimidinone 5'-phosphate reductase
LATYYRLISTWDEDATLCGSTTILQAMPEPDPAGAAAPPPPDRGDQGPLLVVIDSGGKVRSWRQLLTSGLWSTGMAVCSETTPREHFAYLTRIGVETMVVGKQQVDLGATLEALAERGIATIRIDAGPTLSSLALKGGMVDEVSLLVHPSISGGGRPVFDGIEKTIRGRLRSSEEFPGGLVWLRYLLNEA